MKTFLVLVSILYVASATLESVEKRPEFMGETVTTLQYSRLKELQNAAIATDRYLKHLAWRHAPGTLMNNPQWRELVSIYHSMENLVPEEVKK